MTKRQKEGSAGKTKGKPAKRAAFQITSIESQRNAKEPEKEEIEKGLVQKKTAFSLDTSSESSDHVSQSEPEALMVSSEEEEIDILKEKDSLFDSDDSLKSDHEPIDIEAGTDDDGLDDGLDMDEFSNGSPAAHDEHDKIIVNQAHSDQGEEGKEGIANIKERIQECLLALEKKTYGSRSQVISELQSLCCRYYDYSEYMIERLFHLFRPAEFIDFLEASEVPRPVTIRANTLKVKRRDLAAALIARGVNVEPLDKWTPVGLQVFEGASRVPVGATPEYMAGHYMLQAAASFLPVMAMDIPANDAGALRILDMCAAPGGKTTHIAALMRNAGFLAANDVNEGRCTALVANLHRMGVQNAAVSCMDGRKLLGYYGMNAFDRVLLDAPCSGTGVISKDASVKGKTAEDFAILGQLQRELLLAAIDMATVNGVIVYATCAVLIEENEAVVDYVLRKRSVKIVDSGLPFGVPGFTAFRGAQFDRTLAMTRRFYPHTHNLDGFFVAKLIKTGHASSAVGH